MSKIAVLKQNGDKSGEIELLDKLFKVKINKQILYQSLISQRSNARSGNAHAKTRAEISGGGKKPWKQKGTGNARAGSSRSPLWIGGGVTFGPRNTRTWQKRIPASFKRCGILMALTNKADNHKLIVIDDLKFEKISTKNAVEMIEKLPIKEGSILIILDKSEQKLELSFRNLSYLKTLTINNLNIYDIVKYDYLVITKNAIKSLEDLYFKTKPADKEIKKEAPAKSEKAPSPSKAHKTKAVKKTMPKKTDK